MSYNKNHMIPQVLNPDSYVLTGYALPMLVVGAAIGAFGFFILVRERWSATG